MCETGRVEKVSLSHRKIYTDTVIDAPASKVWEVLADTPNYEDWAAFLINIEGEIKNDSKITAVFQMNPQKAKLNRIDHTISVTDGTEFFWAEKGPGGICDNHHFRVEPLEGGKSRFVQSDELMKGLTWLMGGFLSKTYLEGYQAFNKGLKAEAERRANAS